MTARASKAADNFSEKDWALSTLSVARQSHQEGNVGLALTGYRRILTMVPDQASAIHLLGVIELQQDHLMRAAALFTRAVRLDPNLSEAWNNLGVVLKRMGRTQETVFILKMCLSQNPQAGDALVNLATTLSALGKPAEAQRCADRAVLLQPRNAGYHNERALVLMAANRLPEAADACRRAMILAPTFAEAAYHLGLILAPTEPSLSEACYRQAAALRPWLVEAWINLGATLVKRGALSEGSASYKQALVWAPSRADAWNNLGHSIRQTGDVAGAVPCYDRAARLNPTYAEARYNRALARLLTGNFGEAWEDHEWRWKVPGFPSPQRNFKQPQWTGGPINGKRLLLHSEQGYGDAIQFVRYVPLAAELGGHVILEVQPELYGLMQGVKGPEAVFRRGDPLPPFDLHCPLLSLPLAFRTGRKSIPRAIPYLTPDQALVERWRTELGSTEKQRVGLVWAGNPRHSNDHNRSLSLALFAPFLERPGVDFISLQVGPRAADVVAYGATEKVRDVSAQLGDFAQTAALIETLDLVITADTSVAHVAGALGKPVWVLLPFAPDWRWMLNTDQSPWYPSMKLYRQPAPGKWDPVIARVTAALSAWVDDGAGTKPRKKPGAGPAQ